MALPKATVLTLIHWPPNQTLRSPNTTKLNTANGRAFSNKGPKAKQGAFPPAIQPHLYQKGM